jgi:hypothetical protein
MRLGRLEPLAFLALGRLFARGLEEARLGFLAGFFTRAFLVIE